MPASRVVVPKGELGVVINGQTAESRTGAKKPDDNHGQESKEEGAAARGERDQDTKAKKTVAEHPDESIPPSSPLRFHPST
jgi:hypothetical protein